MADTAPKTDTTKTTDSPVQVKTIKRDGVHETHVTTDVVITDPNHELAVQVPEAGRGDALTPIARTWSEKPQTIEEQFKKS